MVTVAGGVCPLSEVLALVVVVLENLGGTSITNSTLPVAIPSGSTLINKYNENSNHDLKDKKLTECKVCTISKIGSDFWIWSGVILCLCCSTESQ